MRTSPCKPQGLENDRPYCIHGPMNKAGFQNGKQKWECGFKKRKWLRENIIWLTIGGVLCHYRVSPDQKEELLSQLRGFRAQQKKDYSEVNKVWLDQLDSPAK